MESPVSPLGDRTRTEDGIFASAMPLSGPRSRPPRRIKAKSMKRDSLRWAQAAETVSDVSGDAEKQHRKVCFSTTGASGISLCGRYPSDNAASPHRPHSFFATRFTQYGRASWHDARRFRSERKQTMCFRPPSMESSNECPVCHATVPAGVTTCPSCGATAASIAPGVPAAPGAPGAPKAPGAPGAPAAPAAPGAPKAPGASGTI